MATPIVYLKDLAKSPWYNMANAVDTRKRADNESQVDKLDENDGWLSAREQQRLEQNIREYFSFNNPTASSNEINEKVADAMDEVYSHVPGWAGIKQRVRYAAGTLFPALVNKYSGIASK